MKKFVRLFVVAMAITAVVAFAGCSSSAGSSSASASGSAASTSASASASASSTSASASASASSASTSASSAASSAASSTLAPGVYSATFTTDSSMFHVNEADDGKGVLTVADDGTMTIHVHLASKKIVNLYAGLAADAEKDTANLLQPSTDTVTYKDGTTEEVHGFDIPVPAIGEEFDVALIGEKGVWYDHKVSVSDPVAQ